MPELFSSGHGALGLTAPGQPNGLSRFPEAVARVLGLTQLDHAAQDGDVYDRVMPFDEAECLRLAIQGDGEAFARLVDYYMPRVYSHVFRMVRRREDAEDVTQEAFVRAWRYLHRYDQARPFRNWLYTIASNLALNQLRSRKRRGETVELETSAAHELAVAERATQAVAQTEERTRIDAAMEQLSSTASALVQLHYREGLAIREAAEILGMKENAAKVALHRARKALREILVESHDG